MEIAPYIQSISALIAAGSVGFGIFTYKRSRLVQQLTQLRAALGDCSRGIEKMDLLLSESSASQVGIKIANEIRAIFGDVTPDELADLLADNDNHDLLVQAIHEGYAQSDVQKRFDDNEPRIDSLALQLRSLAPAMALLADGAAKILLSAVRIVFATTHIKQLFDRGHNLDITLGSLKDRKSTSIAYADLADSIGQIIVAMIRGHAQSVFDEARIPLDVVIRKLMAMGDSELIHLFSKDKDLRIAGAENDRMQSVIQSLPSRVEKTTALFTRREHDAMVAAAAKLQVVARTKLGN